MEALHQCSEQGLHFTPGEHSPEHREHTEEQALGERDYRRRKQKILYTFCNPNNLGWWLENIDIDLYSVVELLLEEDISMIPLDVFLFMFTPLFLAGCRMMVMRIMPDVQCYHQAL
jgi:hypothetical protein